MTKVKKPQVRLDSYDVPYAVGDIVAFKRVAKYRGKNRLEIGKVVRLTPKACAVRYVTYQDSEPVLDENGQQLAVNFKYVYRPIDPPVWGISDEEYIVRDSESILKLSMHSVPPHLFSMLDELEINQ